MEDLKDNLSDLAATSPIRGDLSHGSPHRRAVSAS